MQLVMDGVGGTEPEDPNFPGNRQAATHTIRLWQDTARNATTP